MRLNKNLALLIVMLLLFVISILFDSQIFVFIQSLRNPLLDTFFSWLLVIEKDFIFYSLVIIATVIILAVQNKRKLLPYALSLAFAGGLAILLKITFVRPRPNGSDALSFPSGHATLLAASIPFLSNKTLRMIWIILSCILLLARLWIGLHYLSDIIAGITIGYFIPLTINKIIIHVKKKVRKTKKRKRGRR